MNDLLRWMLNTKQKTVPPRTMNRVPPRITLVLLFAFVGISLLSACSGHSLQVDGGQVEEKQIEPQGQPVNLPTFDSPQQLADSIWSGYFRSIYGNIPTSQSDFPIELNSWWTFNKNDLRNIGVTLPACDDTCPIAEEGQVLCSLSGGDHDILDFVSIYHRPPYTALGANQWAEFTHTADAEAKENEKVGSWMYYVPGSGNYFFLGKTISFQDHKEAVSYFLNEQCLDNECVRYFNDVFKEAKAQGYDSVQFLAHADMTCAQNLAIEIVDVAGSGLYACGEKNPSSVKWHTRYQTGWDASLVCVCSNEESYFNCTPTP